MRKLLLFAVTLALFCGSSISVGLPSRSGRNVVIIEGTILDMSPVLGPVKPGIAGGVIANYRLVKYRVDRVCKGKYEGHEIVVDHVIEHREVLQGRKVGDKVYVLAWRSKKQGTVYTYKGIRDSLENIKYLYHAGDVLPASSPGCSFDERNLLSIQ